jgi:hypothetical protein
VGLTEFRDERGRIASEKTIEVAEIARVKLPS